MKGTDNCVYETPCGWCSKWDKECDKKVPGIVLGAPLADMLYCEEFGHKWDMFSATRASIIYRCGLCGAIKTESLTSTTCEHEVTGCANFN